MRWEAPRGDRVGVRHRQFLKAHASDPLREVGRTGELPRRLLDGDLPKGDRRKEDIRVVTKPIKECRVQVRITGDGPERDVGIQ